MSVASLVARMLSRRYGVLVPLSLAVGLFVAYLATLAPGVTWANHGADSGDLITAAATLGVAHPTGYPTYLLLARLFQLLPLGGDLAVRTTMLSAVAAALAAFVVYATVCRLLRDQSVYGALAASLACVAFGVAPALWSQAVVAEEYALNALASAILLYIIARTADSPEEIDGWRGRIMGLAAGLALGNHVTIAALVAAWLATTAARAPATARRRLLVRHLFWLTIGLMVYLYLPLRARASPPVNWGDPRDLAGFWWVVSGSPYRGLAFGVAEAYLWQRLSAWFGLLLQQFGIVGVGLIVGGAFYRPAGSGWFMLMVGIAALIFSAFAIGYDTINSYAYLLPVYAICAVWLGLGAAALFKTFVARRPMPVLLFVVLLFALLWPAPATATRVDASQDRRAIAYAQALLHAAPPGAIVITSTDQDTFPLWYYHYALGERPDIVVVVAPLLEFTWYRANLRATYPDLIVPEAPLVNWADEIMKAGDPLHCRADIHTVPPLRCR